MWDVTAFWEYRSCAKDSMIYCYDEEMAGIYSRIKKMVAAESPTWPLGYFDISESLISEWANDILQIKKIIKDLPNVLGITDIQSSYHLTPELYEAYLTINQSLDVCFRPDCILTDDGLKIIEFNIDSGSMMVQTGVPPREILLTYLQLAKGSTNDLEQVKKSYFAEKAWTNFLAQEAAGTSIYLWDVPRKKEDLKLRQEIENVFSKVGVEAIFISGEDILESIKNEHVKIFRMFSYPHLQSNYSMRSIFRELEDGNRNLLGVRNMVFDSKINFAFLWSSEVNEGLQEFQKNLIRKYIPETYVLSNKMDSKIRDDVFKNKDQWVLKAINSFQGKDVYLGKDIVPVEWVNLLKIHQLSGGYIVQKLQQPKQFKIRWLGLDSQTVNGAHLLNLFYVNDVFAGSVVRVTRGMVSKIGAVDNNQIYTLPLWIK